MFDEAPAPIPLSSTELERFALVYCERWDSRTAAAQAGIDSDRIVEALGSDEVQHAIAHSKRMGGEAEDVQLARAEEVRAVLWAILKDAKQDAGMRIRAADKLLKSYGGYVHRVQISAPPQAPPVRGLTPELADEMRAKVLGQKKLHVIEAEAEEKKTA